MCGHLKYRFRVLFGEVKSLIENDLRMLCEWKGVEVIELNVQIDHIHIVCSIPPKVSVSELLGTLKGKLAIKIFKSYHKLKQKPIGEIISVQGVILLQQLGLMKL